MSEDLKLSLERKRKNRRPVGGTFIVLLILVLAVSVFNLVWMLRGGGGSRQDAGAGLSAGKLEELALKLEKQHLPSAAARAWTGYLEAERPGGEEAARIWYRIGKLFQENGEYERALEAYYRSEGLAGIDELETEIARRTAECLESLGKFAALQLELESRTAVLGIDTTAGGGAIVAEIGTWKISRAELDMMIEDQIEASFSQMAGVATPEQIREQKEKILQQVIAEGGRSGYLEQFIAEELLYRKAREERTYEKPEVRKLMERIERTVLASQYLQTKFEGITVTEEELQAYFEAHKAEFEKDGVQQSFDEVRNAVWGAVRRQKEQEIQQRVVGELMNLYDVVIHRSQLGGK
ncbi:MAG: hypothetical protein JSV33_07580 [bacterium]|nr:MAG: hypothetical protein JSV33_07580 [bacterium]